MDRNGVACVSEYGLELILREEAPSESFPTNVRWTAPEVISNVNKNKRVEDGKRADIYSFGMVMFEVCCRFVGRFDGAPKHLTSDSRS
jgi:serine/threonine protein kinase